MRTILALAIFSILLFGCAGQAQPQSPNGTSQNGSHLAGPPGGQSIVGTRFSDWRYYQMANQVAPGQVSAAAQAALNVFTVQQAPQSDGSLIVTVVDNQDGTTNNFTLASGQALFFADGNPSDDMANQSDGALLDDHFVVVDGNGTIVQAYTAP